MGNSNLPTVKPSNECDVITIFPMGVNCVVQNPSNDKSFDGAAALIITGGTPPYTIYWEVGSFAPALSNIGVGNYSATVVDYYGDFTANTTCVLTATTLTISGMCFIVSGVVANQVVYINSNSLGLKNGKPYYFLQSGTQQLGYIFWNQPTNEWYFCQTLDCQNGPYNLLDEIGFYPTGTTGNWQIVANTNLIIMESYVGNCSLPVIPTKLYNLCLNFKVTSKGQFHTVSVIQIDLSPSILINGQQSWTSSTSQYLLYWNTSSIPSQWTITGYSPTTIFINNDPTYPPLSNWQILGNPNISDIMVNNGICSLVYSVFVSAIGNNAICGGLGSITVNASGGISPYTYSIDGGLTYQTSPIFNNLSAGIYSVTAKDSNSVVGTYGNVTITSTLPISYSLSLVVNNNNNTFSITAPTLPGGVTLNVNLNMISIFTIYPYNLTPAPTYDNVTTVDGSYQLPLISVTTNVIPATGPCTITGPLSSTQIQKIYSSVLTFTSNQTITGSTTNLINGIQGRCRYSLGSYTLNMSNPIANGCTCCHLTLINPIPAIPSS